MTLAQYDTFHRGCSTCSSSAHGRAAARPKPLKVGSPEIGPWSSLEHLHLRSSSQVASKAKPMSIFVYIYMYIYICIHIESYLWSCMHYMILWYIMCILYVYIYIYRYTLNYVLYRHCRECLCESTNHLSKFILIATWLRSVPGRTIMEELASTIPCAQGKWSNAGACWWLMVSQSVNTKDFSKSTTWLSILPAFALVRPIPKYSKNILKPSKTCFLPCPMEGQNHQKT